MAWQRLGDHLRKTQLLGSIQSALYWDQNTRMPSGGATWRGEQLTLLASELHARQSSEAYADLLADARSEWSGSDDVNGCLLYTSPSPRDLSTSRMPSSA